MHDIYIYCFVFISGAMHQNHVCRKTNNKVTKSFDVILMEIRLLRQSTDEIVLRSNLMWA